MKTPSRLRLASLLLFTALVAAPLARAADLPAFPGAEGFGSATPGGRGGKILFVTNLDDSGPGSFREACLTKGPRIIVFRVGGTIQLKSVLTVHEPYLTIAGQTAPGDGISVRDYTFGVQTHDVVVRYLRSRLGDETAQEADALDILNGSHDIVFDHCSANWSIDECLSTSGDNQNCTIQWCLIGESLRMSKHAKGPHGYGSLARANGPMSWHNNLWIHNDARNPRLGDAYDWPPFPTFDVRNNVMYDFGGTASGLTQGHWVANYVGNYLRAGPSSTATSPIHIGNKPTDSRIIFYINGNIFEGHDDMNADNKKFIDGYTMEGKPQVKTQATPFVTAPVKTVSATEALDLVLASVGASLPKRDPVNSRLIEHVRTKTGKMINSQTEVGGWPALKSGPIPADADNDGIPDAWESSHGLDSKNPADANKVAKSGYTNVEEYLNSLAAK